MADLPQLLQLSIDAYSEYGQVLSADNWADFSGKLSDGDSLCELMGKATTFVCEDGNRIIGVAYFLPSGNPTAIFQADWCYIRMVGVYPDYRGQGIARKLTEMCIDQARQTKEHTLTLHTSEFMNAARHIYESLGFSVLREIDPIFGKRYWLYKLDISNP
jgi:ribosomal protein S18 acetylase RimI-like enzyme